MPVYETQLMDEYFAGVHKQCLVCASFMALPSTCGQTNQYITMVQPVNWVTYNL